MIVKHSPSGSQLIAFAASQVVILFAIFSPLSEISTTLFSAHMLQHVLLMLVAAPLFASSSPLRLLLFVLPPGSRQALWMMWVSVSRRRWVSALWTKPWIAWAAFATMLWVWHLPSLYELAVEHSALHATEHLGLFGSSALFWRNILSGRSTRHAAVGPNLFYLLTMAVHTGTLGALFSFAPEPVYAVYASAAPIPGWRALDDQQVAGLIVWIVGASTFVAVACAVFLDWLNGVEDGVRERERQVKSQEEARQKRKSGDSPSRAVRLEL